MYYYGNILIMEVFMKTITFKADDNFFDTLTNLTKTLNTTKSDVIRRSVLYYKDILEKEKLKAQIKKASKKVKKHSLKISNEFENSMNDSIK